MIKIFYGSPTPTPPPPTPITPPPSPTQDINKCSIASKKLNLIDVINESEEVVNESEQDVKVVSEPPKEPINPHGFRFFYRNYLDKTVNGGTKSATLYELYKEYCEDNYVIPLSNRQFNNKLIDKGYIKYKNSVIYFRVICFYKGKKDCIK